MIAELTRRIEALEIKVDGMAAAATPRAASITKALVEEVASDDDLNSQYGDPDVRRDPSQKYWQGESYVGMRFGQCPPDYLDAMAKYKDACAFMNEKSGDEAKAKYIAYDRRDAARARGWAKRLRAVPAVPDHGDLDDLGF